MRGRLCPEQLLEWANTSPHTSLNKAAHAPHPSPPTHQAYENFQYELDSLRRSFRFDEYQTISDSNPASSGMSKVGQGSPGVGVMGGDRWGGVIMRKVGFRQGFRGIVFSQCYFLFLCIGSLQPRYNLTTASLQ